MSQSGQTPNQNRVVDLKVSGHLMTLEQGLFCVFHTPSQEPPSPRGLPGVRITQPPLPNPSLTISTFDETGWLGGRNNAAIIRVTQGPVQVLVTVYQEPGSQHDAPRLQVVRLSDATAPSQPVAAAPVGAPAAPSPVPAAPQTQVAAPSAGQFEVAAHIQRRGDVGAALGEWMGEPGSRAWIEGFGIAPKHLITDDEIEYQAVLGKGWLSPWTEGGKYCGSRGMALPILGLRVRLKGEAAEKYLCEIEASFTDGTRSGPVGEDETAESESLAPLEAFRVILTPRDGLAAAIAEAEELDELLEDDLTLLEDLEEDTPAVRSAQGGAKRQTLAKPAKTPAVAVRKPQPVSIARKVAPAKAAPAKSGPVVTKTVVGKAAPKPAKPASRTAGGKTGRR